MTELMPYRAPAAELAVPAANDIDSWTQIVGQVVKLANEIYDTPFIPDGLRGSAAAVSACILAGREMGLGPMTSLANIDVIRGKPTQKPLLMRAMILSYGHKWEDVENTDYRAVVRGRRKDESNWTTVTFTADQAKKAGLNLGNWPADKLYARASSRLAKHRFADVIMGIPYTPEDVEDGLDVEVTVTSEDGAATAAIEQPKPRTAQRRQRTQSPPPARPSPPPAAASVPIADAGGDLPPLPGEDEPDPTTSGASSSAAPDQSRQPAGGQSPSSGSGSGNSPGETDYDTPGTVTGPQLTRIWATLKADYGYTDAQRDDARAVCARIIVRELPSSKELSFNEAKVVIDTLSSWSSAAVARGGHPRDVLSAVMKQGAEGDPRDEDGERGE